MRKLLRILPLLFLPLIAAATHQVSGFIFFKHISGYTYQVTLYNYTNGDPMTDGICTSDADRDTMRISYGDCGYDVLTRLNGPIDPSGYPGGVTECDCRKVNIYTGTHTYPGPGSYHIWMDDQNRMADIINIPGSVNTDFYLFTAITIYPGTDGQDISSPIATHPLACEYACTGQCYYYDPGVYSADGDSLSFSLGQCEVMPGYTSCVEYGVPANLTYIPANSSIDPHTGILQWCNPPKPGIFNFSIRVVSYKHFIISGYSVSNPIDTMDIELEIIVNSTCPALDPKIKGDTDTCVIAGNFANFRYTASSPDGNPIFLTASGQPFSESPAASFITAGTNPVTGVFNWQTNCSEVRNTPYAVTIRATDSDKISATVARTYFTSYIHVLGPPPTNLKAKVAGNSVVLTWDPSICTQVTGYQIYRANGCVPYTPGTCSTGMPASSGYVLIGTTTGLLSTTFTDFDVIPGLNYSYIIVATYPLPDGSLSVPSKDTCVLIRRNLPLLTNVSVDSTSATAGEIYVRWVKPLADSGYLDTIALPGPYTYTLYRTSGINGTNFKTLVYTKTVTYFHPATDTAVKDNLGLDTKDSGYRYKLYFFYNTSDSIGNSAAPPASSIYLDTHPSNSLIKLTWTSNVPWTDSVYMVYRKGPSATSFSYLATVPGRQHYYTDSLITNGKTFCYYVKSKSYYADPTILHPLYDSSEIQCNSPKDTIPPCSPKLMVTAQCQTFQDSLIWTNPDHFCPADYNDILEYKIYYSPVVNGDMVLIATITNLNDTTYVHDSLGSIAGCYAVTAVDSFGNQSPIVPVCVDNCPNYTLPNVFTPNGDGDNDLFTPILPYRYVKNIDINVYNRWGQVMFHTTNPMINWDGKDQTTHEECPDGVYYYVCTVNEIRVTGIEPITLKGFLQLIR